MWVGVDERGQYLAIILDLAKFQVTYLDGRYWLGSNIDSIVSSRHILVKNRYLLTESLHAVLYMCNLSGNAQHMVSHISDALTLQVLGARLNTSLPAINTLSAIDSIHPSYVTHISYSI